MTPPSYASGAEGSSSGTDRPDLRLAHGALKRMGPLAALVSIAGYVLSTAVTAAALDAPFIPQGFTNLFGLAMSLAAYAVMRTGHVRRGVIVLLVGIVSDLAMDFVLSRPPVAEVAPFPPVVVIGAGLMLGMRAAWLVAAVYLAVIPAAVLLVPHARPLSSEDLAVLAQLLVAVLCALATLKVARMVYTGLVEQADANAARADRLFERAPDAMVLMSHDGRVLRANRAAQGLFAPAGLAVGDALPARLLRHDGQPADAAYLREATRSLSRVYVPGGQQDVALAVAVVDGDGDAAIYELSLRAVAVARTTTSPAAPTGPPRDAEAANRRIRVLLVDDDALVRSALDMQLSAGGWQVTAVGSAVQALDVLRAAPHGVDVLLTDIVMPGMHGADLMRAARAVRHDLPIVAMSGEPRGYLDGLVLPGPPWGYVAKPFSMERLRRAVADVLAASSVPS